MNILETFRAQCATLASVFGLDAYAKIIELQLPDVDAQIKSMEDQIATAIGKTNELSAYIEKLNRIAAPYGKDAEAGLNHLIRRLAEMKMQIDFYQSLSAKTINLQNQSGIALRISTDANGGMLIAPGVERELQESLDASGHAYAKTSEQIRAELYNRLLDKSRSMGHTNVRTALESLEEMKRGTAKPITALVTYGEADGDDYFMGLKFSERAELPIEFNTIGGHVAVSVVAK